jgi:hypothetical protein
MTDTLPEAYQQPGPVEADEPVRPEPSYESHLDIPLDEETPAPRRPRT